MSDNKNSQKSNNGNIEKGSNSNRDSKYIPLSRGENKGNVPRMENPPSPPPTKKDK